MKLSSQDFSKANESEKLELQFEKAEILRTIVRQKRKSKKNTIFQGDQISFQHFLEKMIHLKLNSLF